MANLKPISIHRGRSITVAQKNERASAEEHYKVGRLHMIPPEELSERAKLKFEQIANEAFWLDELSTDLLAAYCVAWDKWLGVVEAMDGADEVMMYVNNKGETISRQNPLRRPLIQYVEQMCLLSGKLGLGNIDRLKLTLPATGAVENADPFAEYMQKVE